MQKLVFTNGGNETIDLTSGNFGITNWEGLSGVGLNIQTQQVPFQDGGVFLDALMEQREISVTVAIQDNNDLSARYERKRQLISALNPKLGEGVLVYTNDYLSRQIKAVPQLPIFENKNSNDAGTLKASVTFSCCSPYWEDVEETVEVINYGIEAVIENNGDIPAQIKIETSSIGVENPMITNETTGKQISYKGTVLGKLTVDTNYGKKQVTMNKLGFKFSYFGGAMTDVCISLKENVIVATSGLGQIMRSRNGINWELIETPSIEALNGVVYSEDLGMFVAVGGVGTIITSKDGVVWTEQTSGISSKLTDVVYADSLSMFVACGEATTLTSTDGITWTDRNVVSGLKIEWIKVLGLFIAIGANGSIQTSTDGILWTAQTSGTERELKDIIYISEYATIYVVGNHGTILSSTDGITWNTVTIDGLTYNINTLCYDTKTQQLIIAVGTSIYKTSDFNTWTLQVLETVSNMNKLLYIPSISTILGVGTAGLTIYSYDGSEWYYINKGETAVIDNVVFAEDKGYFVAVGSYENNGFVYKSNDGKNWDRYDSPAMVALCYSETLGLFVGSSKYDTVYTSEDGETWNTISVPSSYSANLTEMIWIEEWNTFIGIGWSTGSRSITIIKSSDGVTWQCIRKTNVLSSGSIDFWGLAYSDKIDKVVAVGKGTSDRDVYLFDGTNWQEVNLGQVGIYFSEITYSKSLNLFVCAGSSGRVAIGKNGLDWQIIQIPNETKPFQNVCFSEKLSLFILVSNSSRQIYASTNGIDWFTVGGVRAAYYGLCYSELLDLFVATGGQQTISYTTEINLENVIQNMTMDSDIGMNLAIGENVIRINKTSGTFTAQIKYRQKYIGV
jgi:photosystem II stability/assembly factor-like uncharacterized protein